MLFVLGHCFRETNDLIARRFDNLSLDANVRWSENRAAQRASDVYADVGLNWRITPR